MNLFNCFKKVANKALKLLRASWPVLVAVVPLTFFIAPEIFAAAPTGGGATIGGIAQTTATSMGNVASLLEDVSLIAGIGFIMASFFKFHQHKLNPQQVPVSQGITLLLVGGGLTIFPALLPVGGKAIVGSGAQFSSLSDASGAAVIQNLKAS